MKDFFLPVFVFITTISLMYVGLRGAEEKGMAKGFCVANGYNEAHTIDTRNKLGFTAIHCVGDDKAGWYRAYENIQIYPHPNELKGR